MRRLALAALITIAAGAAAVVWTGASGAAPRIYKVRAIFDDAGFAVSGEQVRIVGATIGSIESLAVTADKKAAVTFSVDDPRFTPFYANATCAIRPQSLIAERYIDCTPGSSNTAPLHQIAGGPGAGSYYLPVSRTSSPVDSDIVQNIYQQPIRQRFAIILDELGTGLAARGSDLNAVIHRANPALGQTDRVLKILAGQNRTLAALAKDSDAVLKPLAVARRSLSDFVVQANRTSVASASRAPDIRRSFQRFPVFLRQLRPLMVDLGKLADQGTPLMADLGRSAAGLDRQFENLAPFADAARPALIALGRSSQESQPALVATEPLARRLGKLGSQAVPAFTSLARLTKSLDDTGAIEQLMSLLFYGVAAGNGFDAEGHYIRDELNVGACTAYAQVPVPGCRATFNALAGAASAMTAAPRKSTAAGAGAVAAQAVREVSQRQGTNRTFRSLLGYLIGNGR